MDADICHALLLRPGWGTRSRLGSRTDPRSAQRRGGSGRDGGGGGRRRSGALVAVAAAGPERREQRVGVAADAGQAEQLGAANVRDARARGPPGRAAHEPGLAAARRHRQRGHGDALGAQAPQRPQHGADGGGGERERRRRGQRAELAPPHPRRQRGPAGRRAQVHGEAQRAVRRDDVRVQAAARPGAARRGLVARALLARERALRHGRGEELQLHVRMDLRCTGTPEAVPEHHRVGGTGGTVIPLHGPRKPRISCLEAIKYLRVGQEMRVMTSPHDEAVEARGLEGVAGCA
mmetsp:Transcript_34970/g.109161  ORF Transcript_34970/g.109161 Transcript_34970/m.109161 type:complete len:292 (-) Transcript_34970:348-1223(-)